MCEFIGIGKLDEDDLYENLGWLAEHQESIEKKLFSLRFPNKTPSLFLYDVPSSYLEGACRVTDKVSGHDVGRRVGSSRGTVVDAHRAPK